MLNRSIVKEFLDEELKEIEIPKDIFKKHLQRLSVSMLKMTIMIGWKTTSNHFLIMENPIGSG